MQSCPAHPYGGFFCLPHGLRRSFGLFVCLHTQAAAGLLLGTHDFTQFSNDSTERLRRNPVKTLQRYNVVQVAPNHVRLEVRPTQTLATGPVQLCSTSCACGVGLAGRSFVLYHCSLFDSLAARGCLWAYGVAAG